MHRQRPSTANSAIRLALTAALAFHAIFGALLTAEMAAAQAGATPGDSVVICTPDGLKVVSLSDMLNEGNAPSSGCACACATTCCHGGATSPALLATPVAYPALNETGLAYGTSDTNLRETHRLGIHGTRAPPLLSV